MCIDGSKLFKRMSTWRSVNHWSVFYSRGKFSFIPGSQYGHSASQHECVPPTTKKWGGFSQKNNPRDWDLLKVLEKNALDIQSYLLRRCLGYRFWVQSYLLTFGVWKPRDRVFHSPYTLVSCCHFPWPEFLLAGNSGTFPCFKAGSWVLRAILMDFPNIQRDVLAKIKPSPWTCIRWFFTDCIMVNHIKPFNLRLKNFKHLNPEKHPVILLAGQNPAPPRMISIPLFIGF